MAFSTKRLIYESLPVPVKQSVLLIPFSWCAGKAYRAIYRRGAWFDQATPEELHAYRVRKLGWGSKNDVPYRELPTDYVDKLNAAHLQRCHGNSVASSGIKLNIGSLKALA